MGSDDWATREWYSDRCNNLLFALISPDTHDDPEVRHRLHSIKRRHLEPFSALSLEWGMFIADRRQWLKKYGIPGCSKLFTDSQLFWMLTGEITLVSEIPKVHPGWFIFPQQRDEEFFCAHLRTLRMKP